MSILDHSLDRRRAARAPERRPHASCGATGPGWQRCRHCMSVDQYRDRREVYLDQLDQCGRGDTRPEPVVTWRWWLLQGGAAAECWAA